MRGPFSSLRVRLLALVLVAVVPAVGIFLAAARDHREILLREARDEARVLAQLVAERNQRAVDQARGLLIGLATRRSMTALDGDACSREVAPILVAAPEYGNVGAVALDGTMFCSAVPLSRTVSLADREHVRGALDRAAFAAGRHVVARAREVSMLGFGYPVRDASGRVVAAAIASLDLRGLQAAIDGLSSHHAAEVWVVDRGGAVLAAHSRGGAPVGRRLAEGLLAPMERGERVVEVEGADGVLRVYGLDTVRTPEGEIVMRVAAGIPAADAYAAVDGIARASLLGFGAIAVLALLAAGLAGEFLLVRKLRALMAAARRIAAGDYGARSGLVPGREELGDLVRAFDEMARSLERLSRQNRLLLDSVGEGIYGVDCDGRVVFANPATVRATGWREDELLGKDIHALVHRRRDGSPIPADECCVLRAMREGAPQHGSEEVFWRKDGTCFPVDFVATPLVDSGEIVGCVVAFADATERRRLTEQLQQAQKMEAIGQLAGGVAHDFNNLLTAITSFAHLVEDALPVGHESRRDVAEIVAAAHRATGLTRQLLAFSRRQRLEPRVVDAAATVRGMEEMLRRLLGESIVLAVDARAPGTVRADPGQLGLAVMNLVVNARDAMPGGGRIVITVDELPDGAAERSGEGRDVPEGPLALVSVRDTGIGMDAATRARIFEPFFTTKAAGTGTGLGLSTVYGIVSQSGGAVRVRSTPGCGSEFRIYLPLHRGAPAAGDADGDGDAARPRGGTETVLVVEDDAAIRAIVRRSLAGAGYAVLEAASPDEALHASRAHDAAIHLLLTDVILPSRTGWELSRELGRERPALRVLFMSGYAAQHGTGAPILPSDVAFLAKPFAPRELLDRVRRVLDDAA